ncbi:MAG: hypothetical protein P1U56_20795 [Saprospiraceae bacterium]|nr:hypothetical protein [Saprospiraceae bacterium]
MKLKIIVLLAFALMYSDRGLAQNQRIDNLRSENASIKTDYMDVRIESWKEDYIEIQSSLIINMSNENDKHELTIVNKKEGIQISSKVDISNIEKMVIRTDKEGNKTYTPIKEWNENEKGRSLNSIDFGYEIDGMITIYVPESMKIKMESIYGDVNLEGSFKTLKTYSTYGLIEANLQNVSGMENINLNSTYDIVDLTIGESSHAHLHLSTSYGEIYSNLPAQKNGTTTKNYSCGSSNEYVLNEGSVPIHVNATYDNIYIRTN